MPKPKLELAAGHMTVTQVQQELGLSHRQLILRIERGILPEPTFTDNAGVRYFNDHWLKIARSALAKLKNYGNKIPVVEAKGATQ